jgi:hypothetical protein
LQEFWVLQKEQTEKLQKIEDESLSQAMTIDSLIKRINLLEF